MNVSSLDVWTLRCDVDWTIRASLSLPRRDVPQRSSSSLRLDSLPGQSGLSDSNSMALCWSYCVYNRC